VIERRAVSPGLRGRPRPTPTMPGEIALPGSGIG
jgi:hypothetical protein